MSKLRGEVASLQDKHAEELRQQREAASTELAAVESRAARQVQLEKEVLGAQWKAQQAALTAERESLVQQRMSEEMLVCLSEQVGGRGGRGGGEEGEKRGEEMVMCLSEQVGWGGEAGGKEGGVVCRQSG